MTKYMSSKKQTKLTKCKTEQFPKKATAIRFLTPCRCLGLSYISALLFKFSLCFKRLYHIFNKLFTSFFGYARITFASLTDLYFISFIYSFTYLQ